MTPDHYRCPHCDAAYDHELLARIHVTRADDDQHANRNGLMPECEIELVDNTGTVIDRQSRRPETIDLDSLTRDDFPDELSSKRTDAVLVAAHHPDVTTRSELTELIKRELADTDRDPPAERTVGRVLESFYHPHKDTLSEQKSFAEIPTLQQAIIIANLTLPDASIADVAQRVDCSDSYPPQVMRRREYLVTAFEDRLAEGDSLAEIVTDELSPTRQQNLRDSGHLTDVPIQLESPDETHTSETPPETTDTESERLDSDWGSPTDEHAVMTATPPLPATETETDGGSHSSQPVTQQTDKPVVETNATDEAIKADTDTETPTGESPATRDAAVDDAAAGTDASQSPRDETETTGGGSTAVTEQTTSQTVVRQLQELKSNLEFFRDAVAPVDEPSPEKAMLIRLTENTEAQCEQIIQQVTEHTDVRRD
jgi:hypothetical protein